MEWKVVYVGCAENSSFDQILDEIVVGPVPVGTHKFILQTDAPDPALIPESDLLGITVILVTCSYREQEFARVGYYVNNEFRPFEGYNKELHGEVEIESPIDLSKVFRRIVAEKPRVTRFPIQWSGPIDTSEGSATETGVVDDSNDNNCPAHAHNHYDEIAAMDSEMEMDEEDDNYISLSPLTSPEKQTHGHGYEQQRSMVVSPDWGTQNSNHSVMVE